MARKIRRTMGCKSSVSALRGGADDCRAQKSGLRVFVLRSGGFMNILKSLQIVAEKRNVGMIKRFHLHGVYAEMRPVRRYVWRMN